jgi:putative ABC transport system substrate-binding protein
MRQRSLLIVFVLLALILSIGPASGQSRVPRIGVLTIDSKVEEWMTPFIKTLREHGFVDGKNIVLVYRDAGGDPRNLAAPAAELVQMKVDILFPVGPPAVRAAVAATTDIPIVAHDLESDPVAEGYAQSYSRPGKNVTGLFLDTPDLAGKWVELLKAIVPKVSRAVVVWDATSGPVPLKAVRDVAPSFGITLQVVTIHTPEDIDKLPSSFQGHPQALISLPSPMLWFESARLARLATNQKLPATSMFVRFAEAGGILAFGPEMANTAERCGELVAKVLAGAKPGNLPIERPTKFELTINARTAKALKIHVPDTVLLRADRVIQ